MSDITKEDLKAYSFLKSYRRLEKKLAKESDEKEKKILEARLNKTRELISKRAYEMERIVSELEKRKEKLEELRKKPGACKSQLRDEIRKIDSEIFRNTHSGLNI